MPGATEEVRGRPVVMRFDGGKCIHSRMDRIPGLSALKCGVFSFN